MPLIRRKRPFLVKILGAGPAGLFAAQAVYDMGGVVQIYARGERSQLYGAQYLHQAIPDLTTGPSRMVDWILKGTVDDYRRKVYGEDSDLAVSPAIFTMPHFAHDIRQTYDSAWDRFSPLIQQADIKPQTLAGIAQDQPADLIVWSIPLAPQCIGGHQFQVQSIWAQGDAPELGRYCAIDVPPWTIAANGEEYPRWYRASNVFGYKTVEWPDGPKPPISGVVKVDKPIATNCTCWEQLGRAPVVRVGRYGTWTKGELSHSAYTRVRARLKVM